MQTLTVGIYMHAWVLMNRRDCMAAGCLHVNHKSETACMLAGLGSLVCAWLASRTRERMQLHLAGRTGRATPGTGAWLQSGTAIVHLQRCDVASSNEAQLLCTRPHAGPLNALIHAGRTMP